MSTFRFPTVSKGDIVCYMTHHGVKEWYPLLVTSVGSESLDGIVYVSDGAGGATGSLVGGVIHVDDPRKADLQFMHNLMADGDSGVFCEHPSVLMLRQRLEKIESVLDRLVSGKPAEVKVAMAGLREYVADISGKEIEVVPNETPLPLPPMSERFKAAAVVDQDAKAAALAAAKV